MKYKPVFELFQNLHLLIYTGQFITIQKIPPLKSIMLGKKGKITKNLISQDQKELLK